MRTQATIWDPHHLGSAPSGIRTIWDPHHVGSASCWDPRHAGIRHVKVHAVGSALWDPSFGIRAVGSALWDPRCWELPSETDPNGSRDRKGGQGSGGSLLNCLARLQLTHSGTFNLARPAARCTCALLSAGLPEAEARYDLSRRGNRRMRKALIRQVGRRLGTGGRCNGL